jgi:stress response protein SCP2
MAALQFNLTKDAGAKPLAFALSKNHKFHIELYWDSKHDLDAHAMGLRVGSCTDSEMCLSTYNPTLVQTDNPSLNNFAGSKAAFRNACASLSHLGDKRTGISVDGRQPDEVMTVEMSRLPSDVDEVSFFVTAHPPQQVKFKDVDNAKLVIKDDAGVVLLTANLTHDFDQYDMVQMGSIVKNAQTGAWDFNPVAVGINGSFQDILNLLA